MQEFKCQECEKTLYSEEALQQHMAAKHTKADITKPARKIKPVYIIGVVLVIIIIAAWLAMGIKAPSYTPKTEPHDKFLGNESASVIFTEYSDYQCPFCARFDRDTEPQIISDYVDTGKMKIIFKNFPLPTHDNAEKAAEAAECAFDMGGQTAFWQLHEKMFQNNNFLSDSNLKKFASEIGLNMTDFDACLGSGAMRARVMLEQQDGQKSGVTSTPTFFVNGQKIEGAQPYLTFKTAIDGKLAVVPGQ